jgi:hypothetical protein
MTHTTTLTGPPAGTATGPTIPLHPSDILMNLIVALLAPMFLGVSVGDIGLARLAATETVHAYRARNHADLIAVAQIIAFGLAALGSLSLSLADDISLSMALRLRGNANALNRSAEQNRRALRERRDDAPNAHHAASAAEPEAPPGIAEDDTLPDPERLLTVAAEQTLAAEAQARLRVPESPADQTQAPPPAPIAAPASSQRTAEKRHQQMWAIAMVKEAGELSASIPNLPPAERNAASIRAAALGSTANELLTGVSWRPPPLATYGRPATT